MPKIVVVDNDFENADFEVEMAREAGVELEVFQERTPEGIVRVAADADGAITSYGNFPREVFEALPRLKVVSRTGTGYDAIDLEAATEHGVAVCNVPGYGTEVVSDHAIALTMACLRRINQVDADIRAGIWDYARHRPLGQVRGRVFGVVGMGQIGRAVARKASGLGFRVVCYSRSLAPGSVVEGEHGESFDVLTLDELLRVSDVVSLHTALTPQTRHLIDASKLALMKDAAVLVNTSRGAVVDTVALAETLEDGRLWGAGIDVYESEPVDFSHPLLAAPRTVLSSHAAYWSEESGIELRARATQAAIDVVLGRVPADCLNPEVFSSASGKLEKNL